MSQDKKAAEPTEETFTVKAYARKKKRTIDELAKDLPVEEVVITLPESQCTCGKCGGRFHQIGRKLVRREMIIIPLVEKILEYYSCTYACDQCEKETGYAHIISTKPPPGPGCGSMPAESTAKSRSGSLNTGRTERANGPRIFCVASAAAW